MKPSCIICIGNRYCEVDGAGPRVWSGRRSLRWTPRQAGDQA